MDILVVYLKYIYLYILIVASKINLVSSCFRLNSVIATNYVNVLFNRSLAHCLVGGLGKYMATSVLIPCDDVAATAGSNNSC